MVQQGVIVLDSNDKDMPEKYKEFLGLLKSKALRGKIRDNKGHLEFFSSYATLDTDYWEGYQVFIVDLAEAKK